ncbi:MAG: 39S ribosomal protein L24, mitochondrial [Alectoria sarmentosa]|nr:MAG: 39S ribosomal protein L24, mitochondrial [Alectoria sarmentosa]
MAVPKLPSLRYLRSFSTTLHTAKPTATQSHPPRYTQTPPPYPYGPALHYKQSDSGLYGGATLQFGNKVSEKNALKSRRAWRPNIHNKRLWSDGLGRFVQIKVQSRVLRTIDKCGGLDEYLLGEKPQRIKELGVQGWRLRWLVLRTGKVRRRVRAEREALGLVEHDRAVAQKRFEERKAMRAESAGADALADGVERASGDVVGQTGNSIGHPSPKITKLETSIDRLTRALEAATARRAQKKHPSSSSSSPFLPPNALPPQNDEPEKSPTSQAAQALQNLNLVSTTHTAAEERLGKRIEEIEEAVEAAMEDAEEEEDGRERLEAAMERLWSAREGFERVRAEAGVDLEGEGKRSEGGVWGKIKGFFRRG